MIINTLHKAFNKQTDYIGKGNVFARTQLSSFIRAYNTREHAPGIDRDFDLKVFNGLDIMLKKKILELTEKETVILYKFRHWDKTKEIIHGYIITSVQGGLLFTYNYRNGIKSESIMNEVKKIICV